MSSYSKNQCIFTLGFLSDIATNVDEDFPTQTAAAALSIALSYEVARSLSTTPIALCDGEIDRFRSSHISTRVLHDSTTPNRSVSQTAPSRAITIRGRHVASVVVSDDVIYRAVHVITREFHRSCLALADSGAAISCINASTFETIRRRCPGTSIAPSDKPLMTYNGKVARCTGTTTSPITPGSLTVLVKLITIKNLVADLILGVNYLYHLNAVIDFDNEVIRLRQRTTGMRAIVPVTNIDQLNNRPSSIFAIATMPLEPYEQRVINVRMPSNYVDKPGLVSQSGAVSMGSASVAHGYFDKIPKTSKLLFANPTGETIIIHAGTRVGSVIPTHLNPSDLLS
jgi:hypothetical protein